MQPFTIDQSVIAALLFLLGMLIGMYLMAGGKWKRTYLAEAQRREELEIENERLRADAREMESLRHAAAKAPAQTTRNIETSVVETERVVEAAPAEPYRRVDTTNDGTPDIVIRRP